MYCVKCGVKLQENVQQCPLCGTPVWNPDADAAKPEETTYSDIHPLHYRESRLPMLVVVTVLSVISLTVLQSIFFGVFGNFGLSGLISLGVLLAYVLFVLPFWFERPFLPAFSVVDHLAIAGFVYYVCRWTGGHWFTKFALPVLVMSCILITYMICVLKYVRKGKIFYYGGFLILLGIGLTLVEFFQHLYVGSEMFIWSQFYLIGLGVAGLLLIVIGLIRPLREALERHFFF